MSLYTVVGTEDDDDLDLDALAGDTAIGKAIKKEAKKLARNMVAARMIDPKAVGLEPQDLANRRRKVLPGNTAPSVASGASTQITYTTQEVFRPERYVVDPAVSSSFAITSIKVGTKNQLASDGQVPAAVFDPTAFDCDVHFDTANPGVDIAVGITNTSGAAAVYRAAFLGTAVS